MDSPYREGGDEAKLEVIFSQAKGSAASGARIALPVEVVAWPEWEEGLAGGDSRPCAAIDVAFTPREAVGAPCDAGPEKDPAVSTPPARSARRRNVIPEPNLGETRRCLRTDPFGLLPLSESSCGEGSRRPCVMEDRAPRGTST
jgi:hypothetical protein